MASSKDNEFPVVYLSTDGWSTETEATATCFCGAVQVVLVSLPDTDPGPLVLTLIHAPALFSISHCRSQAS